jgi:ABC-type glycerol-3-phosphate transport system substrate-binding protein
MNFALGFSVALWAMMAPASFSDPLEGLAARALPDTRIALTIAFFSDPAKAKMTAEAKLARATAHWRKKRAKKLNPFLPKQQTAIEAWLFDEDAENLRWPIQVFNEHVPQMTINLRTFSEERTYFAALQNAFGKSQGPDVVMVKSGWMPMLTKQLKPAPEPLYIPRECTDFFFAFACEAFTDEKQVYAIPLFVRSLFVFANRELLADDRIVVGDRPSESWKGFLDNEQKFRKFQAPEKYFFFLDPPDQNKTAARLLAALLIQAPAGQPPADAVRDGVRLIEMLYAWSKRENDGYSTVPVTAIDRFLRGDTAVIFGTEEEYRRITRHFVEEREPKIKIEDVVVAPLPFIDAANRSTLGESWGLAVPHNSAHGDAAWAFLTFLAEEENISDIAVRSKRTPSRPALSEYGPFRTSAERAHNPPVPFGTLDFEQKFAENIAALLSQDPLLKATRQQAAEALEQFRLNYERPTDSVGSADAGIPPTPQPDTGPVFSPAAGN